ncbi:MAG: hypothetical protein HYT39_02555 [Candidatus Sungbacteria bacterium]|nr:hypothetical protein [Candidatus Sungbacteria bacterium]
MKKIINSSLFIFKALFLILLLFLGWVFINVSNLIKSNSPSNGNKDANLFGSDKAKADAPAPSCSNCSGGDCGFGCPHVAYFDGTKFKIENDFLGGRPEYFITDYANIKSFQSLKRRFTIPDLLKFSAPPRKKDGKLIIQLQENELEESFVDWVKLIRVIHPKTSEVFVDSSFEKIWVLDKSSTEKNLQLPQNVLLNGTLEISGRYGDKQALWESNPSGASILQRGDFIEFTFQSLSTEKAVNLFVKSVFRDWMPGKRVSKRSMREFIPQIFTNTAARMAILAIATVYFFLGRKGLSGALAFTPFIVGSGGGGGGGGGGDGGSMCGGKSIYFSYKDPSGKWKQAAINKPRAWNYGAEIITLPKGAVREDGSLEIRADFTKRHALGFLGALQDMEERRYRIEELTVEHAESSRAGDVTSTLSETSAAEYLHLIPGDTVDVEFRSPELNCGQQEGETYLMKSFGFYSAIRKESKALAGNWEERISEEARTRLKSLIPLEKYTK